jgi:hypothetical protein
MRRCRGALRGDPSAYSVCVVVRPSRKLGRVRQRHATYHVAYRVGFPFGFDGNPEKVGGCDSASASLG